ncbi:serine hydrolase [Anaerocolumna sp. AGMB13025]|uniref:serine hydrolase domain-containing protein n=1 Tax=Anaerocolumna sp. AGMB13025 TaxID=3039116 RepID=UPI00241C47AD|nr:serine hydrolase domain-containing protein [Anaerocolumna sp. AGMB13025]WFR58156.1 serine hydrolase [Anaerocolumna sp. AGMB13025]
MKKLLIIRILIISIVINMLVSSTNVYAAQAPLVQTMSLDGMENTIDKYMSQYIGNTTMGAAVAVIKDGKMVFSKGYGYSDKENRKKVNANSTVFEFASISKLFTWTAVMQQVEKGKIDLNENILSYLPQEFIKKLKHKLSFEKPITMLDLMNHTAGFEERYFDGDVIHQDELSGSLEDALLKSMPKQVYKPGTVVAYSNFGAALAGYIVECVTGEKLYDYLEKNIFQVIGMTSTTANPRYADISYIVDNKAKGYDSNLNQSSWTYVDAYPDGSLNGTVTDLANFAIAFMKDKTPLFEKQAIQNELFTTTYQANKDMTGCAHGFWEYMDGVLYYQHGGAQTGFTSLMSFSPSTKTGLIILTNNAGETNVTYGLTKKLLGNNEPKQIRAGINLPDSHELDGMEFSTSRRNYTDVTKLLGVLSGNDKVKAIDNNTIKYKDLTFVQTEPYLYELKDEHVSDVVKMVGNKIFFVKDKDNNISKINEGGVVAKEYLRMKPPYTNLFLIVEGILYLVIVLAFLLYPLFLIISTVLNRKKKILYSKEEKKQRVISILLNLIGFAITLNQILLMSYLLGINTSPSIVITNFFIYLNIILLSISFILLIFRFISTIRNKQIKTIKLNDILSTLGIIIMTILMIAWNFTTPIA